MTDNGAGWVRLAALRIGQQTAIRYGDELWKNSVYTGTEDGDWSAGNYLGSRLGPPSENLKCSPGWKQPTSLPMWHPYSLMALRSGRWRTAENMRDLLTFHGKRQPDGYLTLIGMHCALLKAFQQTFLNFGILTRFTWDGSVGTLGVPPEALPWLERTATETEIKPRPTVYWDTITALEPSSAEVFDLSVPGEESFVGNGFINHNLHYAKSSAKTCVPCP